MCSCHHTMPGGGDEGSSVVSGGVEAEATAMRAAAQSSAAASVRARASKKVVASRATKCPVALDGLAFIAAECTRLTQYCLE